MSKLIYTKEILEEAVKNSVFYTEVFQKLGARLGGNTYQRIRQLVLDYGIDTSHFQNGRYRGFLKSGIAEKKPWTEILVDGLTRRESGKRLTRALRESGRRYECECCSQLPEWNGKPLTLQVDHIDGNWRDCRKENLRFVCPNCHTQMPTFCNQGKGKRCDNCKMKITSKSKWCKRCAGLFQNNKRKVERPALEIILSEVEELGYVGTGRKYGVSDNAVRKWIKTETKRNGLVAEITADAPCSEQDGLTTHTGSNPV